MWFNGNLAEEVLHRIENHLEKMLNSVSALFPVTVCSDIELCRAVMLQN